MPIKPKVGQELKDHFWSKVDKKEDHECWEFQGGTTNEGYGRFHVNRSKILAHRFAYEAFHNRKIPYNLYVLHRCDNPTCCNPIHLFLGTQADNMRDMVLKNRSNGTKISLSKAKYSASLIKTIRELKLKMPIGQIIKLFNINYQIIHRIWNSKTYPCREGYFV